MVMPARPALRLALRLALRRHLGAWLRHLRWRADPQICAYLDGLDSPLEPGLTLWLSTAPPPADLASSVQPMTPGSPEAARALARAERVITDRPLPDWAQRRAGQSLILRAPPGTAFPGTAFPAHSLRQITKPPPARPQIALFCGGWKNNGITSSALNLTRLLADRDLDLHVVTDSPSAEAAANLARLDPRIHLILRPGPMPMTRADHRALTRFHARNGFANPDHAARIQALFLRESRRIFGAIRFDAALDFSGYSRDWAALIAATPARRHLIWQHNDLHAEAERRFDSLKGVFATYRGFDHVVSVSEETRQVNLAHLSGFLPRPEASVTLRNCILPDHIRAQATQTPAIALPDRPFFAMAGRLSPEKAVERAIRALALLADREVALLVMGTGPQEGALRALVATLGLGDRVILAGHVANPFPVIARAAGFVLSSDYEGQPMVLLEALTLGRPVLATDIPGARSVLRQGGDVLGDLVAPTPAALAEGMARLLQGALPAPRFDAEAYQAAVLQDFLDLTLGPAPRPYAAKAGHLR